MRTLILSSGIVAAGLIAGQQAAVAQSQEKAFCLEGQAGSRNCIYDTFEECQQIIVGRSEGGGCIPNPAVGTIDTDGNNQENAFCLDNQAGSRKCIYDTFEQCQQIVVRRSEGGGCIPNPAAGTIGAGGRKPGRAAPIPSAGFGRPLPPPAPRAPYHLVVRQ
jgi:hypothetical protein